MGKSLEGNARVSVHVVCFVHDAHSAGADPAQNRKSLGGPEVHESAHVDR